MNEKTDLCITNKSEDEIAVLQNQIKDLDKRITDMEAGMKAALGKK